MSKSLNIALIQALKITVSYPCHPCYWILSSNSSTYRMFLIVLVGINSRYLLNLSIIINRKRKNNKLFDLSFLTLAFHIRRVTSPTAG